jgi:hypothetical protein
LKTELDIRHDFEELEDAEMDDRDFDSGGDHGRDNRPRDDDKG